VQETRARVDGSCVTRTVLRSLCLALAAAAVVPASASAFGGAYVRGDSFPTSWQARELLIRVACPPATQSTARAGDFSFCTGTIVVRYRGQVVAQGPFSIRTFDSHVEKVRVSAGKRGVFQPGRHLRVGWTARSHDGQDQWATRSGAVTVFNPYATLR
jgi:hypothetical protein